MDSKLEELFNGVILITRKMSLICSLAIELNLPDEINNNFQLARSSLANCKGLIKYHMHQNSYKITSDPYKGSRFILFHLDN